MPNIKELLISPLSLVPWPNPTHATHATKKNAEQRSFQPCKCDSDNEDNDFGMAPECAFHCTPTPPSRNRNTKKRKQSQSQSPRTKTRRTMHK